MDKTRKRGNWAKYEGILKQERGKEKKENWYESGDTEETNAGRRKTMMMLMRMEEKGVPSGGQNEEEKLVGLEMRASEQCL